MINRDTAQDMFADRNVHDVGLVRMAIAGLLLSFGALFASISHICTGLGRLWVNQATADFWLRAVRSFQSAPRRGRELSEWERRLLGIGPSLISSIFGALALLWGLLLVGGVLFWLVMHGWGLMTLIGTVVLGVIIGCQRARLRQQLPPHELLN